MEKTATTPLEKPRGRPREFDIDIALDRALVLFSERGFHGTAISDLTKAMGLASGSIYKAFHNKEAIFLAAIDRYRSLRSAGLADAIERAPNGREQLRAALHYYARASHGEAGRRGCLVVAAAAELSTLDPQTVDRINGIFENNEATVIAMIRQGQTDGSISSALDTETAARLMLCILQGMRVLGKTGRSLDDMASIAELAMTSVT